MINNNINIFFIFTPNSFALFLPKHKKLKRLNLWRKYVVFEIKGGEGEKKKGEGKRNEL